MTLVRSARIEPSRGPAAAHSTPIRALAFALAFALGACAGDDVADRMATTTQTLPNGATLVRHTPPRNGVPITWRLDEELRIGTVDGGGPAQFGDVAGLAVAADGRIVVLDEQAQEVRVFGPDGRHLRTLGGKGGGPGEMEGATDVVFGPDGLLRVPDVRNARLSFFDLEEGFVRSHAHTPGIRTWPWNSVVAADGSVWSPHRLPGTHEGERGRIAYVGYDTAGSPFDTLAPYPLSDLGEDNPARWNVWRGGQPVASLLVPFYPQRRQLLDPRLRTWSTAEGDPDYRLTRVTRAGDTTLVIETRRPLQSVDPAAADSIADHWEERVEARLDRSRIPDVAPAIVDYFPDDDGRFWVHVHTADPATRTFDLYDGDDGAYIGTLTTTLPLRTDPRPVIRGEVVWGVVRDEMDVSYVVRARLVEAGGDR